MLEIREISVAYQQNVVISNFSLSLNPGEVFAIIGPNGAGKTSLINAISAVLPLHAGSIYVNDKNLLDYSTKDWAKFIAVVPQARSLPAAFTVYHTVLLGRTPYLGWLGKPSEEDTAKVQSAIQQVNLEVLSDRTIGSLSGGEQQRVLLARALAQDTPILLLDEPTAHLDIRYQASFLELVHDLATAKQLTVLLTLHDLNLAANYAHRILLLADGQTLAIGTPKEVLTSHNLSQAYGIPIDIIKHPIDGHPLISIPKKP